ncbi:putative mitochondrial-processing peptidase subunit beta [Hibiscus syriacus]|uniref:Mitochondrial-processing peptidase subunit beta n=1 Tax=Hibiscus syriacus TaxID=106335 RepID=A0A6A2XT89_HIBSY|nr:putative mitochondrial-processing peptidase subunit beta [Hibiscus syriacus]
MAIKQLLSLARRSHKPSFSFTAARSSSSAASSLAPAESKEISPPPPTSMIYDRLAVEVKSKLQKLENPDPRFLKYGSPHPTMTSHTHILSPPKPRSQLCPMVFVWQLNLPYHPARQLLGEQTTYYAKVMDTNVFKALDILADILQNSKFQEHRISRERDVILREMEEVEGQTEEVIFDHLHSTAFQYTPLGRTILGPADNIRTITKDHLQNYIQTHYTAPRMVIAASGAVKHEEIVEQVKKLFTKLSSDPITGSQLVMNEPATFTGSEVRMINDDVPVAQFAVAFEGASWTDPDSIALMVMQAMLGSWSKNVGGGKHMGSDLVQRVSINEIAESMMAFNTNYKDTGLFGVYAVAKPDCLDDLAFAIMHEITKLAYRVSEADVIRARNQLKSSLMLHIDGTSPVAEDIGRQLLTYGRRIPFAELFARIDAVDPSTVKRVANRFIYDRDIAIAAMGPIQGLPDYNWFRRRTYWNRY